MRISLFLLLLGLGVSTCPAQMADKTLSERLRGVMTQDLDKTQVNDMQGRKFEGSGSFKIRSANETKGFDGAKDFSAKNYTTRSFFGIKNPWLGNKVFDTQKSDLWTKNALNEKDKKFAVDPAKIKGYEAGNKTAAIADGVETKSYTERGKTQGAIDAEHNKKLTVDEVREILNKNH